MPPACATSLRWLAKDQVPFLTPGRGKVVTLRVVRLMSSAVKVLAGLAVGTGLVPASLGTVSTWVAPAGAASIIDVACGSGVEARNCPPLCAKLAGAVEPSKFFHVLFGKEEWHLYGEPQDVCTYAEVHDPSSTVTDEIDGHETVADFENQVKVTKEFNRGAKVHSVRGLGAYATDIVRCIGTGSAAWCYPNFVVYSKGYLVQAGEALSTVNLTTMDRVYAPELVAWVKALLAKA